MVLGRRGLRQADEDAGDGVILYCVTVHLAEHGEGKYRVWADVIPAGDGLVVFTGGGEDGLQGHWVG
jgi:hypothetical protein